MSRRTNIINNNHDSESDDSSNQKKEIRFRSPRITNFSRSKIQLSSSDNEMEDIELNQENATVNEPELIPATNFPNLIPNPIDNECFNQVSPSHSDSSMSYTTNSANSEM